MEQFDLESAHAAARMGALENWVHAYLNGPAANPEFSVGLRVEPRSYRGPCLLPLRALTRLCGPEVWCRFQEPSDIWRAAVEKLLPSVRDEAPMPPLLVQYDFGEWLLTDGNHRHAAFLLAGQAQYWCIIWYPDREQLEHHKARGFRAPAAQQSAADDTS